MPGKKQGRNNVHARSPKGAGREGVHESRAKKEPRSRNARESDRARGKVTKRVGAKRVKSNAADCYICGAQGAREVLAHQAERVKRVLVATESRRREFAPLARAAGAESQQIERAALSSLLGSATHQDVAVELVPRAALSIDDFAQSQGADSLVVLLDQVQDPHNLGAILRACEVYGVDAAGWPLTGSAPLSPAAARSAVGASELVPVLDVSNLARSLERLKERGYWVIAADEQGEESPEHPGLLNSGRRVLLLGAEGAGLRRLSREKADFLWALPTFGRISSLNVSQAAAVCLHEMRRSYDVVSG